MSSIVTEFQKLRIPYKKEGNHHCRPGWVQIDCPFCGPRSNKWHLGFNEDKQFFHCWKCGPHRMLDVFEALGITRQTAVSTLASLRTYQPPSSWQPRYGTLTLPEGIGPLRDPHKRYLAQRGFDPDYLVEHHHFKGFGPVGPFKWRLFIPIMFDGEVVSWTTRAISDSVRARYVSAKAEQEAVPHKHLLYNEDNCTGDKIVVCEGPFDAIRIGNGAVCTFGTTYSTAQFLRLSKYSHCTILFDCEPIALDQATKLGGDLCAFCDAVTILAFEGSDPADARDSQIETVRREYL